MTRKNILAAALMLTATTAYSAPLSPAGAIARIPQGLFRLRSSVKTPTLSLIHEIKDSDGIDALFVFDNTDSDGFVILSADDMAAPVLGYCDSGEFDPNGIPPQLSLWLDGYARQIEHARKNASSFREGAPTWSDDWTPVEPMISSKWNQDTPFNNLCPEVNGSKSYTGCVATAMSQVMNYWKYPESGQGTITYRPVMVGKELSLDLSELTFDWEGMLDEYTAGNYTDREAEAVATLMKAAGYSVLMEYSPETSGAMSLYIRKALVDNFKYDGNTEYVERAYYSSSDWTALIYGSLLEGCPVIYDGQGSVGGHSFICDGYDSDGFFHMNWGWGGKSDGYFRLEALNPEYIGIGGFNGGFNFTQDAIINIRKPTGNPVTVSSEPCLAQCGSLTAFIEKGRLKFGTKDYPPTGWLNNSPEKLNFSMGFIFTPLDAEGSESFVIESVNMLKKVLDPGQYIPYISNGKITYSPYLTISKLDIPDGKYNVTLAATNLNNEDTEWKPVRVPYGCHASVIIDKTGDDITVTDYSTASATVIEMMSGSDFYYECPASIRCKFTNETDMQTTQSIAPVLIDSSGKIIYTSGSIFFILNPGESIEYVWDSVMTDPIKTHPEDDMDYTLAIYDSVHDMILNPDSETTVTMHPYPGIPTVSAKISCPGATMQNIDGKKVYVMPPSGDIEVCCTLDIEEGVFTYPLDIRIAEYTGNDDNEANFSESQFVFLTEGQSGDFRFTAGSDLFIKDTVYQISMCYETKSGNSPLGENALMMVSDNNGIEELPSDGMVPGFMIQGGVLHLYGAEGIRDVNIYGADGTILHSMRCNGEQELSLDINRFGKRPLLLQYTSGDNSTHLVRIIP